MFENPRRGRQARNFATNVPKILELKSSSEQIFSENCRWMPLTNKKWPWASKVRELLAKRINRNSRFLSSVVWYQNCWISTTFLDGDCNFYCRTTEETYGLPFWSSVQTCPGNSYHGLFRSRNFATMAS